MGFEKFAQFIARVQPDAIVPLKSSDLRSENNAFVRAADNREIVIMDGMTHWFLLLRSLGWQNDYPDRFVSGADVIKEYFKRISDYFTRYNDNVRTYDAKTDDKTEGKIDPPMLVLLMDKSRYVNPGKRATQEKRAFAQKKAREAKPPYGDQVKYFLEGVRPEQGACMQSIDIERAINARGQARVALRQFLIANIAASPPLLSWPENTQLYVDSEEGVMLFRANKHGALYLDTETNVSQFENKLGEADIAAVRWTQLLHRPTRLITTDTDWIGLHTYHFWERMTQRPSITWDNNKDISWLSIASFVAQLRDKHHFARDTIIALGIFSGCDYFLKSKATYGIGHDMIYDGILDLMEAAHANENHKPHLRTMEGMREALWHIYARRFKCQATSQALLKCKIPKRMTVAIAAYDVAEVYLHYKLAYDYFCSFVCWEPKNDPVKHEKDPVLRANMGVIQRIRAMRISH